MFDLRWSQVALAKLKYRTCRKPRDAVLSVINERKPLSMAWVMVMKKSGFFSTRTGSADV